MVGMPLKALMISGSATPTMIPISPPMVERNDRLDEELADDLPALGADGAADADLAGSLGDRGEHDVHDADAADKEADSADGAQDYIEHPLGRLGLSQQGKRHDDLIVRLLVEPLQHRFQRRRLSTRRARASPLQPGFDAARPARAPSTRPPASS